MNTISMLRTVLAIILAAGLASAGGGVARADSVPTFRIELKDGTIAPPRLEVPANQQFKIELHNAGTTAAEFESKGLRKEKALAPGSTATILIRKLAPGEYDVFDDFHPQGGPAVLVAQ